MQLMEPPLVIISVEPPPAPPDRGVHIEISVFTSATESGGGRNAGRRPVVPWVRCRDAIQQNLVCALGRAAHGYGCESGVGRGELASLFS